MSSWTQECKEISLYFFESSVRLVFLGASFVLSVFSKYPLTSVPEARFYPGSYFFLLLYSRKSMSTEHQKLESRESMWYCFHTQYLPTRLGISVLLLISGRIKNIEVLFVDPVDSEPP